MRETSHQLDAARACLNPQHRDNLTRVELEAFAREHVRNWLASDADWRNGAGHHTLDQLAHGTSALIDVVEERPPHKMIHDEADELLRSKGIALRKSSPAYLEIVEVIRDAAEEALRGMIRREEGERVPTPDAPNVPTLLVSQVFTKWSAMGGVKGDARSKTVDEARKILDAFTSLHGDLP